MKQRNIFFMVGILIAFLCIICGLLFVKNKSKGEDTLPRGFSREYSFKLVNKNNTADNCWVSFGAQVYDITRIFAKLDQAQASELVKYCGTNLDTLPEVIKTAEKLAQYQIGILTP